MLRSLIAIVGTTGAGKSQLSIDIARAVNGEIINADSMQMYRCLDIMTNKHPVSERGGVPHHLLGHVQWTDDTYSVQQFEKEAHKIIEDIHSRGKVPILVGGTHYYVQSVLLKNATIASTVAGSALDIPKRSLTSEEKKVLDGSPEVVFEQLKKIDPLVANKLHPNDHRRLRRALEVYYTTGKRASDIYAQQEEVDADSALRYKTLVLWVYCDKNVLDPRLDGRVDDMVNNGLYKEIEQLYAYYKDKAKEELGSTEISAEHGTVEEPLLGPSDITQNMQMANERTTSVLNSITEHGVFQVIGFKEFLPWLESGCTDAQKQNSGLELMKQATRKYAVKQTRWISRKLVPMIAKCRNKGDVALLDATDLQQWKTNVGDRGVEIARCFLNDSAYTEPLVPPDKTALVAPPENEFSREQWIHHRCDMCDMVLIGDRAWQTHVASKKHRRNASADRRKEQREKWTRLKAQKTNMIPRTNENTPTQAESPEDTERVQ